LGPLSQDQLDVLSFSVLAEAARRPKRSSASSTVPNRQDSMSEMGEMEALRLQMAMDRLSKLMSTLSNLLKKASETASGITQNIK
jgi:hypothetical protein